MPRRTVCIGYRQGARNPGYEIWCYCRQVSKTGQLADMPKKRLAIEMGMGTDLHGQDYTKAAVRALKDALWHNSLSVATALGYPRESMLVEVEIGVAQPEQVDCEEVAKVLPYGSASVRAVQGGLDVLNDEGSNTTVIANAAAVVYLDMDVQDDSASGNGSNQGGA